MYDLEAQDEAIRQMQVYRAAFLGLRELSSHTLTCTQCVHMASGGPTCPVYERVTNACQEANKLNGNVA